MNTIRWASEIRPSDERKLPAEGKIAANLKAGELKMAEQFIHDMTGKWKAEDCADTFSAAVHKLVNPKVKAAEPEYVAAIEDGSSQSRLSNVIDLTDLLAKSLAKRMPITAAKPVDDGARKRGMATLDRKAVAKRAARKRA